MKDFVLAKGIAGVLSALVLLPGCIESSGGDSDEAVGDAVEVESAVSHGSRAHWLQVSRAPFELAMQGTSSVHMAQEPIEWFYLRALLAQSGIDDITPPGDTTKPDCSQGAVEFSNTEAHVEAIHTDCLIEMPEIPIAGPPGLTYDEPQVWDGEQRFERTLDDPDWERVYVIEYDGMEIAQGGTPYWFLDGGKVTVRYRAINDIEIEGSMTVGVGDPGESDMIFHDYRNLFAKWQPDGAEGARVSGSMELSLTAEPASSMERPEPFGGLFGKWQVETKEPIRYEETETKNPNPYAGELHITAEDGNTIVFVFERSGLFMDGVFISWERFKELENNPEEKNAFFERNF